MPNTNTAHIVLRNVRLSYTHLDKPYASQPGQEPKYSATVLVPKNPANNRALIDAAAAAATQKAIEKYGKTFPATPKVSVHDGDGVRPSDGQPFSDECKGCWVFTASSKTPVNKLPAGAIRNSVKIEQATLISGGNVADIAKSLFDYYQLRFQTEVEIILVKRSPAKKLLYSALPAPDIRWTLLKRW